MKQFDELYEIPPRFFEIENLRQINEVFPIPTLLHLDGRRKERVFVSVILHGNEDAGFLAIKKLFEKYKNHELPRALSVFFGNVKAAKFGQRLIDGQIDFNRVWPGTLLKDCPEAQMMAQITEIMGAQKLFASIDIHNNTGKNPHYACVNVLDFQSLQLARLFSSTIVFFQNPKGVQSMAFAQFCPSVALECGKTGFEAGAQHAFEFIDAVLHSVEIPNHALKPHEAGVYQTIARVQIPNETSFAFDDESKEISLLHEIEKFNFSQLDSGAVFANSSNGKIFDAYDDENCAISEKYFENKNGEIRLKEPMMPAMLTLDEKIIRQDCLCYLMEKIA